jgi:predicted  nucleic acid-binding Zn-ribbon protein
LANDVTNQCGELSREIDALVRQVQHPDNANATTQATLRNDLSKLEGKLKTLTNKVGSLVTNTSWHANELRKFPQQLTAASERVSELEPYVGYAAGNATLATSLQGQLTTTEGQLATTQGQLTTTEGQLATTQGQLTTTEGQLTTTQGQLATTQGQLATTQEQLTTTQSDLTAAQGHAAGNATLAQNAIMTANNNLKAVKNLMAVLADTSMQLGEKENAEEALAIFNELRAVELPTTVGSSDDSFTQLAKLAPRIQSLQDKTKHHPNAIKTLKGEKSALARQLNEANEKVNRLEEALPATATEIAESIVSTIAPLLGMPVDSKDAKNNLARAYVQDLLSKPTSDKTRERHLKDGALRLVTNSAFAAKVGDSLEKQRTLSLLSHAAEADIRSHPNQVRDTLQVLVHVRDGGRATDAAKNLIAMETAVGDAHVLVFRLPGDVLPTILRKDEDGTVTQILERSGDTTQLSDASRINNLLALVRKARARSNEKGASDLVNAVMSLLPSSTTIAQVLKSNMLDQKHPPVATATDIFDVARLMDMDIEFKPGIIRYSQVMTVPNVRIEDTSNQMIERTRYNNTPAIIYYEKFRHTLMGWIMGAGDKLLPINQDTVLQSFPNAFLTRQFRWSDDRKADDGLNDSRNTLFSQTPDAELFRVATNLEKSGFRTILFKPSDTEPEVAVTRNGKIQDPELFLRIFNGVRSNHIRDYLWPERAGRIKFMPGVRVVEFKDDELFEKPPTNEMREKIMGLFKT